MSSLTPSNDDLSYLRNLAESGRDAPLIAGPYLIAAGSWFAAASLAQWPVVLELLQLGEECTRTGNRHACTGHDRYELR